eukprot:16281071-Heterocapsa_arctica.AAC.1
MSDRDETVKCRLVACEVKYGEWRDAFAATPTSVSMRLLLQRALVNGWRVVTADVSTAFLHAKLDDDDEIYVLPPETEKKPGYVWRVRQALYGLR